MTRKALGRKITIKSLPKNKMAGMIKVCHGLGLDGGVRKRDWKYIWYHLDKNYKILKESDIILLSNPLKTIMLDCKEPIQLLLNTKQIAAALNMRIAAAVKADCRSRQLTPKTSPAGTQGGDYSPATAGRMDPTCHTTAKTVREKMRTMQLKNESWMVVWNPEPL